MTPEQEYELGQSMLAHEAQIDRSYLFLDRARNRPFPLRRKQTMAIIGLINSFSNDDVFTEPHITADRQHSSATVRTVLRKLVICSGITKLKRKTGAPNSIKSNRHSYIINSANRLVIEDIIHGR